MKELKIIIISAILFFCFSFLTYGQTPFWKLEKDSMNLAILELDYQTHEFIQGHFSVHKPCDDCDKDSLPFLIDDVMNGDIGYIKFLYFENNEQVFHGSVIFLGTGKIKFPPSFFPKDSFRFSTGICSPPQSIKYYKILFYSIGDYSDFNGNIAWQGIQNLEIIKDFAKNPYRIGIYLYPPAVGPFEPENARWIIFVYQGKLTPNSVDDVNMGITNIYPNPFSESTTIHYNLDEPALVSINIYNSFGSKICNAVNEYQESGEQKFVFDRRNYPSGLYFYTIQISDRVESGKMVIIK
ncbi:MAG: T9SS type A sorting domain-containing protein [bacterium]